MDWVWFLFEFGQGLEFLRVKPNKEAGSAHIQTEGLVSSPDDRHFGHLTFTCGAGSAGVALSVKNAEYVLAARQVGGTSGRRALFELGVGRRITRSSGVAEKPP